MSKLLNKGSMAFGLEEVLVMKTRKSYSPCALALLGLSPLALANGLNLNSLGSRALSMGGAFVGAGRRLQRQFLEPGRHGAVSRPVPRVLRNGRHPLRRAIFCRSPRRPACSTLVDAQTQTKHYLSGCWLIISRSMTTGRGHRRLHPLRPRRLLGRERFHQPPGLSAGAGGGHAQSGLRVGEQDRPGDHLPGHLLQDQ